MKPLLWLAQIFVNAFGITQPTPENANRVAIFIGLLLAGVLLVPCSRGVRPARVLSPLRGRGISAARGLLSCVPPDRCENTRLRPRAGV